MHLKSMMEKYRIWELKIINFRVFCHTKAPPPPGSKKTPKIHHVIQRPGRGGYLNVAELYEMQLQSAEAAFRHLSKIERKAVAGLV